MTNWTAVGLLVVTIVLAFGRFGLIFLIIAGAVAPTLGLLGLAQDSSSGSGAWLVFLAGNLLIAMGYFVAPRWTNGSSRRLDASWRAVPAVSRDSPLYAATIVVGGAAMYHLFASGLPLFSESIETARFDFTSSGFFGIPGRMYLFGVPIVWVMCAASARIRSISPTHYGPWKLATAVFLASSILGGYKSGLVNLLVTIALAFTVISRDQPRATVVLKRWWPLALVSFGYLLWSANLYVSYDKYHGDLAAAIIDRMTEVSAEPKMVALTHGLQSFSGGPLSDLAYFLRKYLGMNVEGSYTVERAISAQIAGVDPASSAWTPPVTIGGVPELVYAFGLVGGLACCLAVGVLIRAVYEGGTESFASISFRAVAALAISTWIGRGGLAYYSLNYAIIAAVVALIYLAFRQMFATASPLDRGRPRFPLGRVRPAGRSSLR